MCGEADCWRWVSRKEAVVSARQSWRLELAATLKKVSSEVVSEESAAKTNRESSMESMVRSVVPHP